MSTHPSDGTPASRGHRYENLFTGTTARSARAAAFCADCGAAGGGLDTCQGCGRSLVPLPWLAAAWAEERAVAASARLGRLHRWGRSRSRAGAAVLARGAGPAALAGASLLLVVVGGALGGAGHEGTGPDGRHGRASLPGPAHAGDGWHGSAAHHGGPR